jgi:tetratricopeptide (TPR) repeat protein
MKGFLLSFFVLSAILPAAAQPARSVAKKPSTSTVAAASQKKTPVDDKSEFDKANSVADSTEKVAALKKFIERFPKSTLLDQARESLSNAAFAAAEENRAVGEFPTAIEQYKLAVANAPTPIPAALFNDSLSKIPNALYWASNRVAGLDIAKMLEEKAATDADQLSTLAMFYIGIENGDEAVRLAELAVKAGASNSRAYATLGLAERVNFRLDESAAAYAKAVELEPASIALKRSLAEIRRATGKADEAVALYREAITADENDTQSRNGLVMSLFDAGKTDDAEKELAAALDANPRNVMLLASAAYWYATQKNSDKAIDLAQRAINAEPRYVWSYIALGRGFMLAGRPLDAEETLLKARSYGNFPSLDYELATARYKSGFYRDAVDALQRNFTIDGDTITANIGNRVSRKGANFADVLSDERRASILEPVAADDGVSDIQLKNLVALSNAVAIEKPNAALVAQAADAFVAGEDNSKYHRQLYAASLLLDKKIAPDKALELAQAAVGNADQALDVPTPGAYVMASELYESRQLALSRGELVKVPQVPHQMLSAILRGRIEDLVGWGMLQQNDAAGATLHFRRAVSILPDKSSWWRSAEWRLGSALEIDGKEAEALDALISSYSIDKPDLSRYTTVAALYRKVNGSEEGLEEKIGRSPKATQVAPDIVAANLMPKALPAAMPTPNIAVAEPPTQIAPQREPNVTPEVTVNSIKAESTPTPAAVETEAKPTPSPAIEPTASPSPVEILVAKPTPTLEQIPSPAPTADPAVTPTPGSSIIEIEKVAAKTEATPTPVPLVTPTPEPAATPTPEIVPTALPSPEVEVAKLNKEPIVNSDVGEKTADASTSLPDSPTDKSLVKRAELVVKDNLAKPPPKPDKTTVAENTPPVSSTPKPLFEPVVITIPKRDAAAAAAEQKIDRPTLEINRANPGDARPRLVDGRPVNVIEPTACEISVNQEKFSLLSNGGEASVLLGVDVSDQLSALKFIVSDPDAITVAAERDFEGIEGRALFVVKSISERTGTFRVTFYLPCGKKDIAVTVQ